MIEGDFRIAYNQDLCLWCLDVSCGEPNNCDFEGDKFCGWKNVKKTDQFDWKITSGAPSCTFLSGPLEDHTLQTNQGSYGYIDSNSNRKIGDRALLISQSMSDTGSNGMCFEFFFHMLVSKLVKKKNYFKFFLAGDGIGALTVYLQKEDLDHSLLIEAKITQNDEDDIGTDDLLITNGYCPRFPAYATPPDAYTTTRPTVTIGITTLPRLPSACHSSTRVQSVTASQQDVHSPLYDHTGNQSTGYYLSPQPNETVPITNISIEGTWSGTNCGAIAIDDIILLNGTWRTISDQCDSDSDNSICGQFNWTRGLASVVQQGVTPNFDHTTPTNEGTEDWVFGDSFDNRWLYAQVNIRSPNQSWQVVFEAQLTVQNPDASVSRDDVSITRGLCPSLGDCTFETDLCSWTNNDMDADMDWLVGSGVH
ncbi:unnamed protein product [Rotaria magnacalcarata]|uniref:MAM domain-containing protein n=2 Tax=Rotaria magnacalcarata TaxID=392030 RepID=A0A816GAZ6_9BILA|nr:unnamed protein product [Rotaria magnacalcarata]